MTSKHAGQIVVVGSLNLDLVVQACRIPQPGETIIGGALHFIPGGKGANQAVAAARLGAQVAMIGKVGTDMMTRPLIESLDHAGVDRRFVKSSDEATSGVALIVIDDQGQNSIVVAPGTNAYLSPADIDEAESVIAQVDILLLQLEIPMDAVNRAAEIAHRHGVKIILNTAPARHLPQSLLAVVDVLIANQSEAALLAGLSVDSVAEAKLAAQTLSEMGVGEVIVTMGELGALRHSDQGLQIFEAFHVIPVDTTAAGDAFVAAFSVALAAGKSVEEAVRWGNAAGALATLRLGAQASLPVLDELIAQLSKEA